MQIKYNLITNKPAGSLTERFMVILSTVDLPHNTPFGCFMAQVTGCQSVNVEAWVQSLSSPHQMCGTGTYVCTRTSVLCCQQQFTKSRHSFVHPTVNDAV